MSRGSGIEMPEQDPRVAAMTLQYERERLARDSRLGKIAAYGLIGLVTAGLVLAALKKNEKNDTNT